MLYIAGISIALLLTVVLLAKPGWTLSDGALGAWFLLIGVYLGLFYLNSVTQAFEYPFLLGVEIPLPLVQVAFLYLYTCTLSSPASFGSGKIGLQAVPTMLVYAYLIPFFLLAPAEKIDMYRQQSREYQPFMNALFVGFCLVAAGYGTATGLILRKHRRAMRNAFSNQDKINWLQYVFGGWE